jgi:acyl-CoA thioesterase FadM
MDSAVASAHRGRPDSDGEILHTETNATVAESTLTEAHADSSTRKPFPLPPEIQRRPPRCDASTALRALEFAIPGQW